MKNFLKASLLLFSLIGCQSDDKEGVKVDAGIPVELKFETLKKGEGTNKAISATCYVLRNNQQWNDFKEIAKMFGPVSMEFDDTEVIVVFDNAKETTGYSIEIKSIVKVNGKLIVKVQKESPTSDEEIAVRLTQPYHGVTLRRTDLPVVVEEIAPL